MWLAVGSAWLCCAEPALWRHCRHWHGSGNSQRHADQLGAAVLGLLQSQADLQAGMALMMSEPRGVAAAVRGPQQAAVPAGSTQRDVQEGG